MTVLLIFIGILANASASVLVKLSSATPLSLSPMALIGNWRLLLAAASYGLAFLAYAGAVTRLPLNVAHPISTAGAIIVVGVASAVVVGERFTIWHWIGYGLLLAGILALTQARQVAA